MRKNKCTCRNKTRISTKNNYISGVQIKIKTPLDALNFITIAFINIDLTYLILKKN